MGKAEKSITKKLDLVNLVALVTSCRDVLPSDVTLQLFSLFH